MKLTNADIYVAKEPLGELARQKFPVMVSYKLAKLINQLNEHLKVIEEVRAGTIKKYGETDEKGNTSVKPESESFPQFVAELNELMDLEVKVDSEKIKLPLKVASTCDKCHHNMDRELEIEASTLIALDKFLEV